MLKTEKMQRVRVYADTGSIDNLVQGLYDFGVIHVTKARHSETEDYGKPLEAFKEVSSMLIAIRAVEKNLGLKTTEKNREMNWPEITQAYAKIQAEKINQLAIELQELKAKLLDKNRETQEFGHFENLTFNPSLAKSRHVQVEAFETLASRREIENTLKEISSFSIEINTGEKNNTCIVAFEKSKAQEVQTALAKVVSRQLPIPQLQHSSFKEEINARKSEVTAITTRVNAINREIQGIKREKSQDILALRTALEIESKKAQAAFNFAATKNLVIVEGWVPVSKARQLEGYVKKASPLSWTTIINTTEVAPTRLKNPKGVKAFEELVKFFSLPLSNELDPTALVAFTFPLFFGMIVGDIGYGLVALALALAIKLKTKTPFLQSLGTMLAISSISSIIFGIIFAEFFGFEHIFGYEMHAIIHRSSEHGLILLMGYSLLFGMLQLALGYLLGAYNELKHGKSKHAIAKVSWVLLEFSLATYIVSQAEVEFLFFLEPLAQALPPVASGGIALLSIIAIVAFEGPIAIMEIPGLISNIFSYLRIMALGLAGVIIALILDGIPAAVSFADPISALGGIALLVLFTVGHLGAIALALFESMIQSMRLQYVEFFSKFFHGGGVQFTAFNTSKTR